MKSTVIKPIVHPRQCCIHLSFKFINALQQTLSIIQLPNASLSQSCPGCMPGGLCPGMPLCSEIIDGERVHKSHTQCRPRIMLLPIPLFCHFGIVPLSISLCYNAFDSVNFNARWTRSIYCRTKQDWLAADYAFKASAAVEDYRG